MIVLKFFVYLFWLIFCLCEFIFIWKIGECIIIFYDINNKIVGCSLLQLILYCFAFIIAIISKNIIWRRRKKQIGIFLTFLSYGILIFSLGFGLFLTMQTLKKIFDNSNWLQAACIASTAILTWGIVHKSKTRIRIRTNITK